MTHRPPARNGAGLSTLETVMGTTTWPTALAGYRAHQLAANRSPGTIRLHRWRLMDLAMKTKSPAAVTLELLRTILGTPTWAPETRKSVRSTFRAFFSWAYDEGLVGEDPTRRLPTITVPRALPRPAPEAVLVGSLEAWRALSEASRGTTLDVELMLLLAGYAGLRAHEIAKVHRGHLLGDELRVVGKGRKERLVPVVHPVLLSRLEAVEGWAFPNRWTGQPVTAGRVTRLVSAAMPAGWTCHTLRHRMATQAYAGTRDLLAVGAVLGHSRPETTQRYVLLPRDAMRAAVTAAA